MKNSIVNFTRGTQLLGHFGFMFAAGFKLPLIISALVVLGMVLAPEGGIDEEKAAHRFAGAFLMPADVLRSEVGARRSWPTRFGLGPSS